MDIQPFSLDERRQLMEREKWINNVTRILGKSREESEELWLKIQLSK
jgi:hypothetical protein